jgi:hypothetical protein
MFSFIFREPVIIFSMAFWKNEVTGRGAMGFLVDFGGI